MDSRFLEALVSVALMGAIVTSLSAVTGQWLPNWHHGFGRVQRLESVDLGLQRLVSTSRRLNLSRPTACRKTPLFSATRKSVTLARVADAPGTAPHLEFVRLAETVNDRGFALVRSQAPFKPLDPGQTLDAQLYFKDPVVLIRTPFRVSFAFAGPDRLWRDSWRDEVLLPSRGAHSGCVAATDHILAVSTAALMRANFPVECVTQRSAEQCVNGMRAH